VKALPDQEACLRSIAEEMYTARHRATEYGADRLTSCSELLKAGTKEQRVMESQQPSKQRCEAGNRAFRKFWEAKACARRSAQSD
jgi:hypothetical protein